MLLHLSGTFLKHLAEMIEWYYQNIQFLRQDIRFCNYEKVFRNQNI